MQATKKISIWNHPSSGQVRVYFNGLHSVAGNRAVKVFAVQGDNPHCDLELTIQRNGASVSVHGIEEETGRIIDEAGGNWQALLAAAK